LLPQSPAVLRCRRRKSSYGIPNGFTNFKTLAISNSVAYFSTFKKTH
jgi:hypothetical protein